MQDDKSQTTPERNRWRYEARALILRLIPEANIAEVDVAVHQIVAQLESVWSGVFDTAKQTVSCAGNEEARPKECGEFWCQVNDHCYLAHERAHAVSAETPTERKRSKAKARRVRQWREGAAAQMARVKLAQKVEGHDLVTGERVDDFAANLSKRLLMFPLLAEPGTDQNLHVRCLEVAYTQEIIKALNEAIADAK